MKSTVASERKKLKQRLLNINSIQDPNIFTYKNTNIKINNTILVEDIQTMYDDYGNTIISIMGKKGLYLELLQTDNIVTTKLLFGKINDKLKESSENCFNFQEDSNLIIYLKSI